MRTQHRLSEVLHIQAGSMPRAVLSLPMRFRGYKSGPFCGIILSGENILWYMFHGHCPWECFPQQFQCYENLDWAVLVGTVVWGRWYREGWVESSLSHCCICDVGGRANPLMSLVSDLLLTCRASSVKYFCEIYECTENWISRLLPCPPLRLEQLAQLECQVS